MAYADQEMSGNRIIALIIVALIHLALGYALITGLAYDAVQQVVERVTTVDVEEEQPPPEDEPPPPEPDTSPPPIVAPPPPINVSTRPPPIVTQTSIPPPAPIQTRLPPPAPISTRTPPPPPPPPSQARGATPRNQGRWAGQIQSNYPSRARRTGTEGDVGVSVVIGANGRVSSCSVTRSSGDRSLDDAACKGMRRYARFNAALDAAGNETTDNYSTTIRYQLN